MQPILVFKTYTETLPQICELLTSTQMLPDDDCTACVFFFYCTWQTPWLRTAIWFVSAVCLVFTEFVALLFVKKSDMMWPDHTGSFLFVWFLTKTHCLNWKSFHVCHHRGFLYFFPLTEALLIEALPQSRGITLRRWKNKKIEILYHTKTVAVNMYWSEVL